MYDTHGKFPKRTILYGDMMVKKTRPIYPISLFPLRNVLELL